MVGKIHVICGPMRSGKSEKLIHMIRREEIAQKKIAVFKPKLDSRDLGKIKSRNSLYYDKKVYLINKSEEIMEYINRNNTDVIAVDEAQFLDYEIIQVIKEASRMGIKVIISGLEKNYKAEPFGSMPQLLAIADTVEKLTAICMVCQSHDATYTYRKIKDENEIVVGDDIYEARCGTCWAKGGVNGHTG